MTPRVRSTHSLLGRAVLRGIFPAALLLVVVGTAAPAWANLDRIGTRPESPTTCDLVTLFAAGTMPATCYTLIGAEIEGPVPLPTMGPIPTYGIRLRFTVQEPLPGIPCAAMPQPYSHAFPLGKLPFGEYWVTGVEYVVPYSPDSSAAPKDSSDLRTTFSVAQTQDCTTTPGCYLLGFGPDPVVLIARPYGCNATGPPGGRACFEVTLGNESPVGGLQTSIFVPDPRVVHIPEQPPPPDPRFQPISVEVTPRAAGFQVAWTTEASRVKILLFSPTGAAIAPGRGPILHVCYAIETSASEGMYRLLYGESVVSDPDGNALAACPTFAEVMGFLCVSSQTCDVNGDGASNILDIIRLVHCALAGHGGTDACPDSIATRADCNGDGSLDVRDVVCCVRKILAGGSLGWGGGVPPDSTGGNATQIGLAGPVEWLSPTEGRATIRIQPGSDFAGMQFHLAALGARVRGMTLDPGSSDYLLEWSPDPRFRVDASVYRPINDASVMLYRAGTSPVPAGAGSAGVAAPPISIQLQLEPDYAPSGGGWLTIGANMSATSQAAAAPTLLTNGSVDVPSAPASSAPAIQAPRPNPFATETDITYSIPSPGHVTLRIYDVNGRLVRTLVDAQVPAGTRHAKWDGTDEAGKQVRSGIYFSKFAGGGVERTDRLLRLR